MIRPQDSRRAHERIRVMPMYTGVTACRGVEHPLFGHVYDISESGVRIELDEPLVPGEDVALQLDLPGTHAMVEAAASVVWVHDEKDDPGPRRMALRFTRFSNDDDRLRLYRYIGRERARQAA